MAAPRAGAELPFSEDRPAMDLLIGLLLRVKGFRVYGLRNQGFRSVGFRD